MVQNEYQYFAAKSLGKDTETRRLKPVKWHTLLKWNKTHIRNKVL